MTFSLECIHVIREPNNVFPQINEKSDNYILPKEQLFRLWNYKIFLNFNNREITSSWVFSKSIWNCWSWILFFISSSFPFRWTIMVIHNTVKLNCLKYFKVHTGFKWINLKDHLRGRPCKNRKIDFYAWFWLRTSEEMSPSLVSFEVISKALRSELFRFQFHSLKCKTKNFRNPSPHVCKLANVPDTQN